jgi:hypothetical protein
VDPDEERSRSQCRHRFRGQSEFLWSGRRRRGARGAMEDLAGLWVGHLGLVLRDFESGLEGLSELWMKSDEILIVESLIDLLDFLIITPWRDFSLGNPLADWFFLACSISCLMCALRTHLPNVTKRYKMGICLNHSLDIRQLKAIIFHLQCNSCLDHPKQNTLCGMSFEQICPWTFE